MKYKLKVRSEDERAIRNYQIHRKYLSKIKWFVVIFYIFIMPFIETPYWCLEKNFNSHARFQDTIIYHCHVAMENYEAKSADVLDLNPIITCSIDLMCLGFFVFFRWFKTTWGTYNKKDKIRNIILAAICIIQSLIIILTALGITTPFIADLLRPFVVIDFFGAMRSNFKEFWRDLWSASTIIGTIFIWIGLYSMFGFYLF